MDNKNNWLIIGGIILVVAIFFLAQRTDLFAVTGAETMTRTASATVSPSTAFTLTYTAVGTSPPWGASIEDSVLGGCKFPSGSTTYKTVYFRNSKYFYG